MEKKEKVKWGQLVLVKSSKVKQLFVKWGGGNKYLERKMKSIRHAEQVKRWNTPVPDPKIDIHVCTRNKECRDGFCCSYYAAVT